jgi:hypothetical protein
MRFLVAEFQMLSTTNRLRKVVKRYAILGTCQLLDGIKKVRMFLMVPEDWE